MLESDNSADPSHCPPRSDLLSSVEEDLQMNCRIADSLVTARMEAANRSLDPTRGQISNQNTSSPSITPLVQNSGRGQMVNNAVEPGTQSPPMLSPQVNHSSRGLSANGFNPFLSVQAPQNPFVNRVTQVVPSLPVFDGREEGVQPFFQALDRAAEFAQWGESDKIYALTLKLQGEAAKFYQDVVAKRGLKNFQEIKEALTTRFERRELPARVLKTLSESYQKPGESVREYASRLEALSFRAFTREFLNSIGGDRAREELLWGTFVEGLKPSLRRAIHHLGPRTFEAAVKFAIEEEEFFAERDMPYQRTLTEAMAVNPVPPQEPSMWKAQQDAIQKLTETVTQLTEKVNSMSLGQAPRPFRPRSEQPRQPRGRLTCFGCGIVGHIRRECRAPGPPPQGRPLYETPETSNVSPENFRGARS